MKLKFNANSICAAERALNKPFVEIITELESEAGASLSTLRALLAAGIMTARYPQFPFAFLDVHEAGGLIDENGVAEVGGQVGKALRAYFDEVSASNGH